MGFSRPALGRMRWRRAAPRIAASVLLLALVVWIFDWTTIRGAIARVPGSAWAVALGSFVFLHVMSALKWRLFLGLAGARLAPTAALRLYGAGLFANLCLPSLVGGDVLRAGLAMRETDAKEAVVLGSVVDRLCDVLALAVVVAGGAVASPRAIDVLEDAGIGAVTMLVVLVACLAGGVLVATLALRSRPLRRWPRGVARRLVEFTRAWRALRRRPTLAVLGALLCVGLQCGFVLANIRLGAAMGFELAPALWFLLWPMAKIAAMLPISFGGLGVREAAFAALVAPFGDEGVAVAQSITWESILICGGLLAGLGWAVTGREEGS